MKHLHKDLSSVTNDVGGNSPSPSNHNIVQLSLENNNIWKQVGPTLVPNGQTNSDLGTRVNIYGRITSIVIHPTDSNTIYMAAAQDGEWKSSNVGKNWIPTSDNLLSVAIGALAIGESNPSVLQLYWRSK